MLTRQKMQFKKGIMASVVMSLFISFNANANELLLTEAQYQTLGLQVAQAKQVEQYPTQVFPAQAMFHPNAIRTLSAPLSGKISRLHVVHGSVSKGQVIAEIESTELLALQSQLLSVASDLKVLQSELKRVKKLRQSGVASAKKLQQAQADVDKLFAEKMQQKNTLQLLGFSKKSLQKLLSSQKIQSSVLSVVSPIDGQIFDLTIRLGERVSENQALFSLGETNPMLLKVKVPVALANSLKKGHQANISGLGLGVVEHIDPDVDAVTQTVDVHVEVDNRTHRIRPGQRFQVHFLMSNEAHQAQTVYQVPLNAITQFEGETVVFIKEGKAITPKVITVKNINNHKLYFSLQQPSTKPSNTLYVFVKGSTAIKSAFDAAQENDA
jgi:RND family efflux transporter MFP subunit